MSSRPWARASAGAVRRWRRARSVAVLALGAFVLAGCGGGGGGGGGGNSGLSLSVSPLNVAVSATTAQPAPSASVQASVSGQQQSQQVYLAGKYSTNGIQSVSLGGSTSPVTVTITFKSPASLGAGTYTDTLQLSGCYDQACTQQVTNSPQTVSIQYTVTGSVVQLTALSPSSAVATGAAFTLTATGSNFTAQSVVQWNGSARSTTYVSATQLTAQIMAADIAAPGTASVNVLDPVNGPSNPLTFTIQPPMLTLNTLSPTSVAVGGPGFMLTVLGAGFSSSSIVQWNGAARPTTYVTTNELIAQIAAADIAALGSASITVQDSTSAVGTTAPQTLTIVPVSKDATAFQMNPAHTGAVTFASVSFPASPTWSVDVGGTPSYAVIANGKVYVTVAIAGGSSQLLALDQATGATAWGPVVLSGAANAAYDSQTLFVISAPFSTAATIEALDPNSGQLLWSALLTGTYGYSSAVTAANGVVFSAGYAFDQKTGATVWQIGAAGGDSTPAVTADGMYLTYPCTTIDYRPATGETIWSNNTGCSGGGGGTPVVANQLLYAPNGFGTYNGSIFNAETGALAGSYVSDNPGAFTASTGYFLQSGTLRGVTLSNNTVIWSFAGDGMLVTSPIAVNQYVLVGSSSGNLYALDGATGSQVWQVTLGAGLPPGAGWGAGLPLSGLAAGDGLLVVPNGTKVTAYTLSTNP